VWVAPRFRVPNTFDFIDDAVDDAWQSIRGNPIGDRIFYTASEAANFSMVWHALGVAKAVATRDPISAVRTSAALGLESAIVNGPLKSLFERERPDAEGSDRPHSLRQPRTSSFPSGHASAAVVAAGYLADRGPGLWRWPVRLLATVVATSRIHVRIHHATDVVAGALTGAVLLKLLRPLVRRVFRASL